MLQFFRAIQRRQEGQSTLEFALSFPIFIAVVLSILQIATVQNARISILAAAREGARWASVTVNDAREGVVRSKIQAYVKDALGPEYVERTKVESITYPDGNRNAGSRVKVTVVSSVNLFFPIPGALLGVDGNLLPSTVAVVKSSAIMRLEDVGSSS